MSIAYRWYTHENALVLWPEFCRPTTTKLYNLQSHILSTTRATPCEKFQWLLWPVHWSSCQEAVCALNAQSSPASCAENLEPWRTWLWHAMTLAKHSQCGKLSSHGHDIEIICIEMTSKGFEMTWHDRRVSQCRDPVVLLPCPSRSSRPSRLSPSPWDSSWPLCPSWSSQSHAATFWHFCVQQGFIHFLYVFLIVSYCLILFHIVSFCFQVKLQIGRNDQNQNISKQSLWQRRLQKRCPGSSLVSSTGGGSSKSGLWESWSVWKKISIIIVAYVCISIMYIYIFISIYISILFEMYRWECTGVESSGHLPAALIKQVAQFKM